jgi:hypothetical protein
MNYLDVDRPGSRISSVFEGNHRGLGGCRIAEECIVRVVRIHEGWGEDFEIRSRHGTSSVVRHRWRAKATNVWGSSLPLTYSVTF